MDQKRSSKAPVVVFVYNRIDDTMETLQALNENILASESDLYIFSDAPKYPEDKEKVQKVRDYILKYQSYADFHSISIRMAERNKGLAKSIIEGVTEIVNEYGNVVVLEDDCVPTKDFLRYMNDALLFFQDDDNIWSIAGYGYKLPSLEEYPYDSYLSYRGSSWGWATWKEMWEKVDWQVNDYSEFRYSVKKRKKFMRGGNDLPTMLKAQMNGKIDSWAVRWCYSQSKLDKLTVFPKESRIYNRGFNSGVHGNHNNPDDICNMKYDGVPRKCNFENAELNPRLVKEMRDIFRLTLKGRIIGFVKMEKKLFRKNVKGKE